MSHSALSKSVRKFLRREKARMRREVSDTEDAEKRIVALVEKTFERIVRKKTEEVIPAH